MSSGSGTESHCARSPRSPLGASLGREECVGDTQLVQQCLADDVDDQRPLRLPAEAADVREAVGHARHHVDAAGHGGVLGQLGHRAIDDLLVGNRLDEAVAQRGCRIALDDDGRAPAERPRCSRT